MFVICEKVNFHICIFISSKIFHVCFNLDDYGLYIQFVYIKK